MERDNSLPLVGFVFRSQLSIRMQSEKHKIEQINIKIAYLLNTCTCIIA